MGAASVVVAVVMAGWSVASPAEPTSAPASLPSSAPAAEPARTILVLPPVLAKDASGAEVQLAASLERALARALARQGTHRVLRMADVQAKLGEAAARQLTGCDDEGCLAQLGQDLGADQVLHARVESGAGLWTLRLSLLAREKAEVTLRRDVRARSVDALFESVDTLAREICGGSRLVADDPDLARRLGTTPAVADELRDRLRADPRADPGKTWTEMVIEANQESEVMALVQGLVILVGGLSFQVAVPFVSILSLTTGLVFQEGAPTEIGGRHARADNRYPYFVGQLVFPTLYVAVAALTFPPVFALLLAALVDRLDLGRIPVAREGCCRDETRIRAAARPGWGRRIAPYLAAVGGVMGIIWPVEVMLLSIVPAITVGYALYVQKLFSVPTGPGPVLDKKTFAALYLAQVLVSTSFSVFMFSGGIVGLVGALLLIASEHSPVVDRE